MAYKHSRTVGYGIAAFCLLTSMEVACGNSDETFRRDVAVALRGAETVYFAGAQTWEEISGPKRGTKALRLLENPLFGLAEILSEAGLPFKDRDVVDYVLISARNFRMPANLGPVLADTLYLIRLRHPGSVRLNDKYRCVKCDQVSSEVWQWDVVLERGERPTRIFGTKTGSVLLVSTNFELIVEAASSVPSRADLTDARKLIASFAGSKRIWGARLYGPKQYKDQLSAGIRAGNYQVAPDAKWSLFELRSGTNLSVRYYSNTDDGGPLHLFEHNGNPVKAIHPGIWEVNLNLGDAASQVGDAMEVLGLFGFGVYL